MIGITCKNVKRNFMMHIFIIIISSITKIDHSGSIKFRENDFSSILLNKKFYLYYEILNA